MDIVCSTEANGLNDVEMELIKDVPWAKEMWDVLQTCAKHSFLNWVQVVLEMSQNEQDVRDWKSTFIKEFEARCHELVLDIKELHETVVVNIEKLLNRTQELCKVLCIEMPIIGKEKLGLYQEQYQLRMQVTELEKMLEERTVELNQLLNKEQKLCKTLGIDSKQSSYPNLPTSAEILELQKHIEYLEQVKFERSEKFITIKSELMQLVEELQYVPSTKFEKDIILGDDIQFEITNDNMKAVDEFHSRLIKELQSVKEEANQLKNKIEQLWSLLDIDFLEREKFREKYIGHSLNTLSALRLELQKCECLKKKNIKVFVDKLREELVHIWKECHCSETIQKEFKFFYSDTYTEDLLELHEIQLQKWKTYANENKEILSLIKKHRILWEKQWELEQNAANPDRYNNRGGRLLKEEKERNVLSKQIPKIENHLRELADQYENRHGESFLTFGETIDEYIYNLHANRENDKRLKLSARKLKKESTMLIATPGTSTMTPKRNNLEFPTIDTKRFKASTDSAKKSSLRHNIPKIVVTTISKARRLSHERKQRINRIRRLSRQKDMRENSTYLDFQNEISNRVDLRSTLNVATVSRDSLDDIVMLPDTPNVQKFKTPLKVSSRTPKSKAKSPIKLSAAKSKTRLYF